MKKNGKIPMVSILPELCGYGSFVFDVMGKTVDVFPKKRWIRWDLGIDKVIFQESDDKEKWETILEVST